MAGAGGGSYFPRSIDLKKVVDDAREKAERQQLEGDVNAELQDILVRFNDRDREKTKEQLDGIEAVLGLEHEIEKFLFGGSVAKHTYVDGLSDVDALVILPQDEKDKRSPRAIISAFAKALEKKLPKDDVAVITKGKMAVTIRYRDGSEVQILPAISQKSAIYVPDPSTSGWNKTNPKDFQRTLTKANDRLGATLVPTIKLFKSINAGLSKPKQLSGYHIEALSLAAVKGYRGPATYKALLQHIISDAATRVLRPIKDLTGQSRNVDDSLGKGGSVERRVIADSLATITRRLTNATTAEDWRKIIGEPK